MIRPAATGRSGTGSTATTAMAAATAQMEWTPYAGLDAQSYQVRRRTAELDWKTVFYTNSSTVTSFTDSGWQVQRNMSTR